MTNLRDDLSKLNIYTFSSYTQLCIRVYVHIQSYTTYIVFLRKNMYIHMHIVK